MMDQSCALLLLILSLGFVDLTSDNPSRRATLGD
jgi:hypothetical protein